jgi:hypothetical protein
MGSRLIISPHNIQRAKVDFKTNVNRASKDKLIKYDSIVFTSIHLNSNTPKYLLGNKLKIKTTDLVYNNCGLEFIRRSLFPNKYLGLTNVYIMNSIPSLKTLSRFYYKQNIFVYIDKSLENYKDVLPYDMGNIQLMRENQYKYVCQLLNADTKFDI